jgi:Tfp pilus assembly protein PilX
MKFGISSKKAGVSLVTVLLFMLVATIAATATYKWLTSEGRSSGSRMQKQMAYQSAVAGIENARAWMTFHANDVGALVKQYMDGNYVPINLDANLRSLQRPGQNHHVWLVGVNTSGSTYKLKVLS